MLVRYPPTREVTIDILTDISIELGLPVKEHAFAIKQMNTILDISSTETVFAFEQLLKKSREETRKQMAALSAPVIPIKDDIVIIPLIGNIDQYRANYIMEHVIPKIAVLDTRYVIVDFSGIFKIDEETAAHLHQIVMMLQLMGIQVLTTGIRPDLANTVVNSQINFAELKTFATVKRALESLK